MQSQESNVLKGKKSKLPYEIQTYLDEYMDHIVEIEKENYYDTLLPFEQHEKRMRASSTKFFEEFLQQFAHAHKVLKEYFDKEEKTIPHVPKEASLSQLDACLLSLREKIVGDTEFVENTSFTQTFQEMLGIDWLFMDRAYGVSKNLAQEAKFDDAYAVFTLLTFLNPRVFEYAFGKASCQYELGNFEDALDSYSEALVLETKNPACFFQIANCLYLMEEFASSIESLKICIEYTKDDPEKAELLQSATKVLQLLEKQIAA
jgi:tetratricopeptide (TPR) repeat protein